MSPIIIDGKQTGLDIREEIRIKTESLKKEKGITPGIAILLIGDDPASGMYVRSKEKACKKIGFNSVIDRRPESISESEVLEIIESLNNDKNIHGILVQLPLPDHVNEQKVIDAVAPEKDVDGFSPVNVGRMILGKKAFLPCTPAGVTELLKRYKIETKGKHVVVVGRSNIVGRPLANLMSMKTEHANSIVTLCHSAADDISQYTKQADILILSVGKPEFIKADDIKKGAVIIDVGINRVQDSTKEKGYRVTGDCDFESVSKKASYITPVPGGVGPMTIAMLMQNTYKAATIDVS